MHRESIDDIQRDLEGTLLASLRHDGGNLSDASVKVAARELTRRMERWAREEARIQADVLIGRNFNG